MVVDACELASTMFSACPGGALVSSAVKVSLRCTLGPGGTGGSVLALEDAWRVRLLSGAETNPRVDVFARSLRVGACTSCVGLCNPRLASTSFLSRTTLSCYPEVPMPMGYPWILYVQGFLLPVHQPPGLVFFKFFLDMHFVSSRP